MSNIAIEEDGLPKILPPKNDFVFKALFGDKRNEKNLIEFLEAVLRKKIIAVQLMNPINNQRSEDDKMSVLDVRAKLDSGEEIDIEMQAKNIPGLRERITYYQDRMLVDQIGVGGKYSALKPVISIIVVAETLIYESQKCHNVFSMLETDEHFAFNDLKETHILDLTRINNEPYETLSDWLEFINSEDEEDFMKIAQKNKAINAAFGTLQEISRSKEQRIRYDSRLKLQRDIWAFEDAAEQKGILKGEKIGIQKGRKKGILEVFALIDQGYTPAQAKKMLELA